MEGKGPYRIYDPGGSEVRTREEVGGASSYRQLLEENSILRERMKGLKSLGMDRKTEWFPVWNFFTPEDFLFQIDKFSKPVISLL